MHARLQLIRSAARRPRSNSWCNPSQTPASCQSRRRRQQVMPDPHPFSSRSISHWMPVRSTNRIPVSAARSDIRGLPPRDRGGAGGSSGSMIDQSASETREDAMPPHESAALSIQGVLKGVLNGFDSSTTPNIEDVAVFIYSRCPIGTLALSWRNEKLIVFTER